MGLFIAKHGATYVKTLFTDGHIEERYHAGLPSGVFASRPLAGSLTTFDAGLPYAATDTEELWRWSGSAWVLILAGSGGGAPAAHATSHQNGGSDEISVTGLSGLLADAQTPLGHHTSHESGGGDAIKLDDLAAPDDTTDLNATTAKHGLLDKLPGGTTTFKRADGAWATPPGTGGSGDVVGPSASIDKEIVLFDGTTGKLVKRATGSGIVRVTSGVYGTPGNVDLTSEVTGDLPFANVAQLAASKLAGRGSAGGTGDIQAVSLGSGLAMAGSTLSVTGSGGGTRTPVLVINSTVMNVTFTSIVLGAASTLVGWYYGINPLNNYNPIWGSDSNNEMYYGSGAVSGRFEIVKGGSPVFRSTNSVALHGWHFLAIVDDGVAIKAYYDDVDMGSTGIGYTSLSGMSITRTNQGVNTNNFQGHIAELAIFSRALSGAELTALYNSGAGAYGDPVNAPFDTGLTAIWHLSEGLGVQALDSSGNGHTGALFIINWGPGPGPVAAP